MSSLLATVLLMVVLSPAGAAFFSASDHNATADFPLSVASRTRVENWVFLPSIHSLDPEQVIDQGDIWNVPNDFASTTVAAGTIHRWRIELYADEVVGITAIAAAPADIVLSLMQNGQPIIDRQNDSPAGEAEVMLTPEVETSSIYEILIETTDRSAAEYAVAAYLPGEFEIEFKGFLKADEPQQALYVPIESTHFWFFTAESGDRLTMELTPDKKSDIVGEVYAPGAIFWEVVDFGFAGESEQITDLPLGDGGLYAIRVFELDIDDPGMVYDIVIVW